MRTCPSCSSNKSKLIHLVESFHIVKCKQCGLVYLVDPPEKDTLYEDYHSKKEPSPNEYRFDSPNANLRELWAINNQRLKKMKSIKPEGSILDVGCGRGFFLKSSMEAGYKTFGIDISSRAIEYARRSFDLSVEQVTIEELLSTNRRFDIITLWHVLEHFADPYTSLQLVRELLADNGVCLIEVPNLNSMKFIISKNKWSGGNHPLYHRTFFTAPTLRVALQKTGFSRIERIQLSYHIPGRDKLYEKIKRGLNIFGLDAFLDFVAWK